LAQRFVGKEVVVTTLRFSAALLSVAALIGCSTTPKPAGTQTKEKEEAASQAAPKAPTLYTARQCFSSMLNLAQRWAPDALPFHMESDWNTEATGQDGKATVWRAFFASRTRARMKTFVCSGSRLPSAPALGFTDTLEAPYAANVPALLFQPFDFLIDSDKAYAVTLEHGGSALIQKDPKQPVTYYLNWDPKKKEVMWLVIYGKSEEERQGLCVINARTGAFVSAGK
jgi:hypothetical protein